MIIELRIFTGNDQSYNFKQKVFDIINKLKILRVPLVNQAHPSLNVEKKLKINAGPSYEKKINNKCQGCD